MESVIWTVYSPATVAEMLDVVAPFDDGPDHKYSYGEEPPEPVAVSVTPEEVHKTG